MKKLLIVIVMTLFILSGCTLFQSERAEFFNATLQQLLVEGSQLSASTAQGVSYVEFSNQLAKTRGIYNLAIKMWPEDYEIEAKENLARAFEGWNLTYKLWNMKVEKTGVPEEPDKNYYKELMEFAGSQLSTDEYKNGTKFIYLENIGLLLTISGEYFESALDQIILSL